MTQTATYKIKNVRINAEGTAVSGTVKFEIDGKSRTPSTIRVVIVGLAVVIELGFSDARMTLTNNSGEWEVVEELFDAAPATNIKIMGNVSSPNLNIGGNQTFHGPVNIGNWEKKDD